MNSIYYKLGIFAACTGATCLGIWCNAPAQAMALRTLPDLQSITFFERTGGSSPRALTFSANSSQLLNQLPVLNSSSNDFSGTRTEYYDVFYSDAFGNLDIDGAFMTIEGVFNFGLPASGGLNLAGMRLNFDGGLTEFANRVASFTALGNNALPDTVPNAVDGNLLTHTTMGNTIGQTERLSLTLGFASTERTPEPSAILSLITLGIISSVTLLKRKRRTS